MQELTINFPAVLRGQSLSLLHIKVELLYVAATVLAKQHLARAALSLSLRIYVLGHVVFSVRGLKTGNQRILLTPYLLQASDWSVRTLVHDYNAALRLPRPAESLR